MSAVHTHAGAEHGHEAHHGRPGEGAHAHGEAEPATDVGANPVLDIGGDVGALVVVLGRCTPSGELEAHPIGAPEARFHTGVHRRGEPGAAAWTAVFPEVVAGAYRVLHHDGSPLADVRVTGGEARQVDLR
jgi:hypothetical protein